MIKVCLLFMMINFVMLILFMVSSIYLIMLIYLEFVMLVNLFILYKFLGYLNLEMSFIIYFLILMVSEAVVGLTLLVLMIRMVGSDSILFFNLKW
uniref:NADH dehydrogenase subunit 4L n=1 Tax=Prosevania sp. ZJUH_2016031 TaxID=2491170 RepID=A0A3S8V1A7_9HYME|nr:NADH dehydrogenase subunit 4L [Prosevania sp. ZJUH_2016031]